MIEGQVPIAIATLIPTLATKNNPIRDLAHVDNFNKEKFNMWKFQMNVMLWTKKLFSIVNSFAIKEKVDDENKWTKKDNMC